MKKNLKQENMKKPFLLILFLILLKANFAMAQDEKFKALFLYNYAKGIEWPSNSGDFVIGVLGSSPIVDELNIIAQKKKVGNQTIVIKKQNTLEGAENCNIFFLPSNKSANLSSLLVKVKGKSTLIVTDSPGSIKSGSCINFFITNDKLSYEISKNNIEKQGLKVTANLLSLGVKIN
jgi:hypothetical protein